MLLVLIKKECIVAAIEDAVKWLEKEKVDTIALKQITNNRAKITLTLQSSKFPKDNLSKNVHKELKELQLIHRL